MHLVTQTGSHRNSVVRIVYCTLVLACLSLIGSLAWAQSSTFSYQGTLNYEGAPATDGRYQMTVTLYSNAQGTEALWTDTYNADVRNGIFNVLLGSGKSLPDAKALDRSLWVGVRIGEGQELRPLTQLSGSPFALNVADKAITKDKMGTDYVASVSVNGQKITGKGSRLNIESGPGMLVVYDELKNSLLLSSTGGLIGKQDGQWVGSGFGTNTANTCTTNTDGGVGSNTVAGGCDNSATPSNGFASIIGGSGNTANAGFSTVAGGESNLASNVHAAITGGFDNSASGERSSIIGGNTNLAGGDESTVGGGVSNDASGEQAAIIGGDDNTASGTESTVGGGISNAASGNQSFIGGGNDNTAPSVATTVGGGTSNNAGGDFSTIAGGNGNLINFPFMVQFGFVGGGQANQITDDAGTVGGGRENFAGDDRNLNALVAGTPGLPNPPMNINTLAVVGGGWANTAAGYETGVLGGEDNIAFDTRAAIVGGFMNLVFGEASIIGGGEQSQIGINVSGPGGAFIRSTTPPPFLRPGFPEEPFADTGSRYSGIFSGLQHVIIGSDFAVIAGGNNNTIGLNPGMFAPIFNAHNAFIGGGIENTVTSTRGTIGGGQSNFISVAGVDATIGGGNDNTASNSGAFIGGGTSNDNSGVDAVIAGGNNNNVSGTSAAIGGGTDNSSSGTNAVIAGGTSNTSTGTASAIGGGEINNIDADHSVIAGGFDNDIIVENAYSAIGGGYKNAIDGSESAIPGGMYLKLGDNSFGFNGDDQLTTPAVTDLSVDPNNNNIAYFGGVDVWIGNVDDDRHELRFYGDNTDIDYYDDPNDATDGVANYTGFIAPTARDNSNDLIYILPADDPVSSGSFLMSDNVGTLTWEDAINLTTHVTGVLPVANGGTGLSTLGAAGTVLTVVNGAPSWQPVTATSVAFNNVTSGTNSTATLTVGTGATLGVSGTGSITATLFTGSGSTSGAVDLATAEVSGTLGTTNGGTGLNTVGTNGQYLAVVNGAPAWQTGAPASSVLFSNVLSGSNNSATMTVATGASLGVSGTGSITATLFTGSGSSSGAVDLATAEVSGTLGTGNGGTGLNTIGTNGQVLAIVNGAPAWQSPAICSSVVFSNILTGTNTSATMTVGSGAAIAINGGDVEANKFLAGGTTNAVDLNSAEVDGVLPMTSGGTGLAGGLRLSSTVEQATGSSNTTAFTLLSGKDVAEVAYIKVHSTASMKVRRVSLPPGAEDGQVLIIVYRGDPTDTVNDPHKKGIKFETNSNTIIRKKHRVLYQNDSMMLIWNDDIDSWMEINYQP